MLDSALKQIHGESLLPTITAVVEDATKAVEEQMYDIPATNTPLDVLRSAQKAAASETRQRGAPMAPTHMVSPDVKVMKNGQVRPSCPPFPRPLAEPQIPTRAANSARCAKSTTAAVDADGVFGWLVAQVLSTWHQVQLKKATDVFRAAAAEALSAMVIPVGTVVRSPPPPLLLWISSSIES